MKNIAAPKSIARPPAFVWLPSLAAIRLGLYRKVAPARHAFDADGDDREIRSPPVAPAGKGADAIDCSLSCIDPSSLDRYHHAASFSPANWNWGHCSNPKIDELFAEAQETFVPAERDNVLASAHELIVDEASWVWFVLT